MLAAAHVLAMDAKNLLDVVDCIRQRHPNVDWRATLEPTQNTDEQNQHDQNQHAQNAHAQNQNQYALNQNQHAQNQNPDQFNEQNQVFHRQDSSFSQQEPTFILQVTYYTFRAYLFISLCKYVSQLKIYILR